MDTIIYLFETIHGPEYSTCSATPGIAWRKWQEYTRNWGAESKENTKARLVKFSKKREEE